MLFPALNIITNMEPAPMATRQGGVCMRGTAKFAVYNGGTGRSSLSPPVGWRAPRHQLIKPACIIASQGGVCTGDTAKLAVYCGGTEETSLSSNWGFHWGAIYPSSSLSTHFHPVGTSSLAILCASLASSSRAS